MDIKQHPMVAVPDAIRTVLRETVRCALSRSPAPSGSPAATHGMPNSEAKSPDDPWEELVGRVLAEDVVMAEPGYPPYNASIMDGYAVRSIDGLQTTQQGWTHRVAERVYAGSEQPPAIDHDSATGASSTGQPALAFACYITTGALVPDSCDCIVPIEECKVSADKSLIQVQPSATIQPGKFVRSVGCDIPAGSVLLHKGIALDPISLGLLKQSGVDSFRVQSRIKVGVLSTGNELVRSRKDITRPGQIPDVNRPILLSLLSTFENCDSVDLGIQRDDDIDAMADCVRKALAVCDVIITTGGISVGESDIVEDVLVSKCGGTLHFGRMHMKPGKPTTFVTIPHDGLTRLAFAMPGNPVSCTVCTHLLVKPCLAALCQMNHPRQSDQTISNSDSSSSNDKLMQLCVDDCNTHPEARGVLTHDIALDAERPEYRRVTVDRFEDGKIYVSSTGVQRSSRLMSLHRADGLLVLPQATPSKQKALAGESYTLLLTFETHVRGAIKAVKVKESKHLGTKPKTGSRIRVIHLAASTKSSQSPPSLRALDAEIEKSLSGSKSGSAQIVATQLFARDATSVDEMYQSIVDPGIPSEFVIVVCSTTPGSLPIQLDTCSHLRIKLTKISDAIAQKIRQGAAAAEPTAALYEVVVGFAAASDESTLNGSMVICLSDRGTGGGLGNVRGLLKHSLNVARGKAHNAHH